MKTSTNYIIEEALRFIPEDKIWELIEINSRNEFFRGKKFEGNLDNIFTTDTTNQKYDFTQVFLLYLEANENRLRFRFKLVKTTSFLIFYTAGNKINSIPYYCKTYKFPLMARAEILKNITPEILGMVFDPIITHMNSLVTKDKLGQILYIHSIIGLYSFFNPDIDKITFVGRFIFGEPTIKQHF